MENPKFTQEIKDNWIENLESGKFEQTFVVLRHPNTNQYCCIGVLGEVTEGLTATSNEETSPYRFLRETIGVDKLNELWKANDRNSSQNTTRDYSNVIPLIKALPVTE